MGEYAEMVLEGLVCQYCGEYMGDDPGYPQTCNDCQHELTVAEVEQEYEQK